jgi:hypothetical protein
LRDYLQGLLLPRDRNKTLTGLAGAEPITAPHQQGALVLDDTGDRKDGTATAHVAASTWARSARSTTASAR